jgi:hypothetical protein
MRHEGDVLVQQIADTCILPPCPRDDEAVRPPRFCHLAEGRQFSLTLQCGSHHQIEVASAQAQSNSSQRSQEEWIIEQAGAIGQYHSDRLAAATPQSPRGDIWAIADTPGPWTSTCVRVAAATSSNPPRA